MKSLTQYLDPPPSVRRILDTVADYYDVTPRQIVGPRRTMHIAHARQVCMYLARRRTRYSLGDIGIFLGDRDHTTVLYGVGVIERRLAADWRVTEQLAEIEQRLSAQQAAANEAAAAAAAAVA